MNKGKGHKQTKGRSIRIKVAILQLRERVLNLSNKYDFINDDLKLIEEDIDVVEKSFNQLNRTFNRLLDFLLIIIIVSLCVFTYVEYFLNRKIDHVTEEFKISQFDSIKEVILPISDKFDSVSNKDIPTITYRTRDNGSVVTYNDLIRRNDSLQDIINELNIELKKKEMALSLAKENYGISYRFKDSKDSYSVKIIAPKIDSTFVLYDIFRHRLFFDEATNYWYVKKEPGASDRIKYVK
ncbi:hypothetical protein [Myroides odoratimimus]|uniref:hypothetical protein n=1 Tax=Myroides odoratimimus TaxID=76832 RepID=UPI00046AEA55|nr:hypothetical protein [Myroides odoratimimus]